MQRIPEKYSAYWLGIAAVLSGIYYLALRSSRMLLGLDISPQNIQGIVILNRAIGTTAHPNSRAI